MGSGIDPGGAPWAQLVRLACRALDAPMALIATVSGDNLEVKASRGLPEPLSSMRELPLAATACRYVVHARAPVAIADLHDHPESGTLSPVVLETVRAYLGAPVLDRDGHVHAVICALGQQPREWTALDIELVQDVARAAKAELDARARTAEADSARAILDAILMGVPDGITVSDRSRRIVYANEAAARTTGYPDVPSLLASAPGEVASRFEIRDESGKLLDAADLPNHLTFGGQAPPGALLRWRRHGEIEERWSFVKSTPLRDASGEVHLAITVFSDVTELKRSEQALQDALRARDDVLMLVSHDLKNPIQSVVLASALLRHKWTDSGVEALAQIDDAVHRMSSLVDELLDAAALQRGQALELARRPLDLVALVRDAIARARESSRRHAFELESRVAELRGSWDRARLERVLHNLISNAVKYSPRGGPVRVAIDHPAPDRAVLTFEDRGIGIPTEDLPHVFSWFRRGSNVGKIPGTGIGLASARRIVELQGGKIDVESLGEGTRFTVTLPVR